MDHLPSYLFFAPWLESYGSFALFFLLAAGILALPVPEESLLVLAGAFVEKGIMGPSEAFVASIAGSILGITLSYLIGKWVGNKLNNKLGWLGITDERLAKVHQWFDSYGKWTLVVGYFVPGLHHLTGFATGMGGLQFQPFALFAFSGALIWASTFLSLGYLLGEYGHALLATSKSSIEGWSLTLLFLAVLFGIFYSMKPRRGAPKAPE